MLLEQNVQLMPGRAWLTHYTPKEGFYRGKPVRWGYGCSERVAAMIMVDRDRQTRKWPDSRKGCVTWIDRWADDYLPGQSNIRNVTRYARYAIIRAEKTW